jgi:hypothetical protein
MINAEYTIRKMAEELDELARVNGDLRATHNEMFHRFKTLSKTFKELLETHLEMRERFGFGEFTRDYEYDWLQKSGLMDDFLLD